MIQISRLLARQVRAIFRKLTSRATAGTAKVSFVANDTGLRIRLNWADILAEFRYGGEFSSEEIIVPFSALADWEARSVDLITLESTSSGVQASWEVSGIPQVKTYEASDPSKLPAFPLMPEMTAA